MILINIFIEEHKALREINVRLNGSFEISYSNKILTLRKTEDTAEYYGGRYCSALIGPNGVGKSSILEILELFKGEHDSRAIIVFYDEETNIYYVCSLNMTSAELKTIDSDSKCIVVQDNRKFLSSNHINLVKINSLAGSEDVLSFKKTSSSHFHHDLTIRENLKNSVQQKKYFEKLLAYFKDSYERDEFMEEIAFEFVFASSPVSIAERCREVLVSNEELITKWTKYTYDFKLRENKISHGTVFQRLLDINLLSIISALAKTSSFEKEILASLLYQFDKTEHLSQRDVSTSNRLRIALNNLPGTDASIFQKTFSENENGKASLSRENINYNALAQALEGLFEIFEEIATILFDHCYDGLELNLRSVKIDYYDVIQNLTAAINRLPSNIASNIKWGWRGISSGELARTHIRSESYHYLNSTSGNKNNILIFDEADLYLHPEWQRTFLHEMLYHLRSIEASRDIKTCQIIICTHSPIIISDFLASDITSLIKNEDGEIEITQAYGFGNSIVDIYMKGMHIKSTFGEHARRKINYLLKKAEQGILSSADRNLIEKIPNHNARNFLLSHDKN